MFEIEVIWFDVSHILGLVLVCAKLLAWFWIWWVCWFSFAWVLWVGILVVLFDFCWFWWFGGLFFIVDCVISGISCVFGVSRVLFVWVEFRVLTV